MRAGSHCALVDTSRGLACSGGTRPVPRHQSLIEKSKSTRVSSKVTPAREVNTHGTGRTRSDHPERGADAQPGRRGHARAGAAHRLFETMNFEAQSSALWGGAILPSEL